MRWLRLLKIVTVSLRVGLDQMLIDAGSKLRFAGLLRITRLGRRFDAPRAVRLRQALETLGPIFVKFGQMLSTRRDLLPPDLADELAKLAGPGAALSVGTAAHRCRSAQRRPGCLFVRLAKDSLLDPSFPGWLDVASARPPTPTRHACASRSPRKSRRPTSRRSRRSPKPSRRAVFALRSSASAEGATRWDCWRRCRSTSSRSTAPWCRGLAGNIELQQQVRALVDAAAMRRIETIAERVEDANTMAVLWQLGVQFIQGYFVNAPEDVQI